MSAPAAGMTAPPCSQDGERSLSMFDEQNHNDDFNNLPTYDLPIPALLDDELERWVDDLVSTGWTGTPPSGDGESHPPVRPPTPAARPPSPAIWPGTPAVWPDAPVIWPDPSEAALSSDILNLGNQQLSTALAENYMSQRPRAANRVSKSPPASNRRQPGRGTTTRGGGEIAIYKIVQEAAERWDGCSAAADKASQDLSQMQQTQSKLQLELKEARVSAAENAAASQEQRALLDALVTMAAKLESSGSSSCPFAVPAAWNRATGQEGLQMTASGAGHSGTPTPDPATVPIRRLDVPANCRRGRVAKTDLEEWHDFLAPGVSKFEELRGRKPNTYELGMCLRRPRRIQLRAWTTTFPDKARRLK